MEKRGRPFEKGNPGRPKGTKNKRTEIKGWAEQTGIDLAARIAEGTEPGFKDKPSLRADMTRYLLDRELGKPKQTNDLNMGGHVRLEDLLDGIDKPDNETQ